METTTALAGLALAQSRRVMIDRSDESSHRQAPSRWARFVALLVELFSE